MPGAIQEERHDGVDLGGLVDIHFSIFFGSLLAIASTVVVHSLILAL